MKVPEIQEGEAYYLSLNSGKNTKIMSKVDGKVYGHDQGKKSELSPEALTKMMLYIDRQVDLGIGLKKGEA